MTKRKQNISKHFVPLVSEATTLLERLDSTFRGIKGPPTVTLSVARGYDDHQYDQLAKLAKKQAHHIHWNVVTEEEMSKYHDCWIFMDAEAVRFYFPAFVARHLNQIIEDPSDGVIVPDEFQIDRIVLLEVNCLSAFKTEERDFIADYLWFIENSEFDYLERDDFRPTRQAWDAKLGHLKKLSPE